MTKRRILALSGLTLGAIIVAVVFFASRHSAKSVEYVTVPASVGSLRTIVNATGTIQPVVSVQVGAQISGQVQEIYADFNTVVKRGQILAKIDPRNFQAQLANVQAKVEAARSAVRSAEAQRQTSLADIQSAKANVAEAIATKNNADLLYTRAQQLSKQGLLSQNDLDVARTNAETADAKYKQA